MNRTGGGILLTMKSVSFVSIREYTPLDQELAEMEIVCAEIITSCEQKLLPVSCYRPPNFNINWVMKFHNFFYTLQMTRTTTW